MTKMTYVNAIDNAINGTIDNETIEKLTALKVQLEKRGQGKRTLTATQKENVGIKAEIVKVLDKPMRANEVATAIGITGQRASALLNQMVKSGEVEKYTEKRVTYFKGAEA